MPDGPGASSESLGYQGQLKHVSGAFARLSHLVSVKQPVPLVTGLSTGGHMPGPAVFSRDSQIAIAAAQRGYLAGKCGGQPTAIAMIPPAIATAAISRLATAPSPSSRPPISTPNSTLTSRAGATTLTAVNASAASTRM